MEALITLSKEIENAYGSIDSFNSDVKKCYQNGEFLQSCNDDQVNLYFEFLDLRNKAYDELCGDNITWRLNLWQKSIFNDNVTITNFIFGHGMVIQFLKSSRMKTSFQLNVMSNPCRAQDR